MFKRKRGLLSLLNLLGSAAGSNIYGPSSQIPIKFRHPFLLVSSDQQYSSIVTFSQSLPTIVACQQEKGSGTLFNHPTQQSLEDF